MKDAVKKPMTRLESHYLLTNIKGVMTYFLVLYHFISGNINALSGMEVQDLSPAGLASTAPVIFAMFCSVPIFVFITGYGSKDTTACRESAFSLYFIPYLLVTLAAVLENLLMNGFPLRVSPFEPLLQLWYLLSLFWWMLLLKDLVRIKGILVIAFVVMFTVGMQVNNGGLIYKMDVGTLLSLSRTLYFLPVLLLGYRFSQKNLSDLRLSSPWWGLLAGGVFVVGGIGTVLWAQGNDKMTMYSLLLLKGDKAYVNYLPGMDTWWKVNLTGTVLTVIFLVLTAALLYLTFRFIPKKRIPLLTRVGDSALTVFCLHGLIVSPIGRFLAPYGIHIAFCVGVVAAVGVCLLLSLPRVHKTYSRFIFWIGDAIMRKS